MVVSCVGADRGRSRFFPRTCREPNGRVARAKKKEARLNATPGRVKLRIYLLIAAHTQRFALFLVKLDGQCAQNSDTELNTKRRAHRSF